MDFTALARGEEGFTYKEYKGTPPANGQSCVSRVLSAAVKGENVYLELKSGPGKLTPTGAITPTGPAQVEINVAFKRHEARRLAAEALAYIHAWDVVRMMSHRQQVGQPIPYLLTAAGGEERQPGCHNARLSSANAAAAIVDLGDQPLSENQPYYRFECIMIIRKLLLSQVEIT